MDWFYRTYGRESLRVLVKRVMDPCHENQLGALFNLSLFRQSTYTYLGHICSPSSGVILYIYNNWYVYICSVPPDDRLKICPKHVEVD
jgi:hypothetical protein